VALAESIIADRCQSYLYFKEKIFMDRSKKEKNYVSTKVLIEKCGKHFKKLSLSISPRIGKPLVTEDLFAETQQWLKARNDILHGFAKANPKYPTINTVDFHHNAIQAAEDGLRLTKFISKWHKQQLKINNKNNSNARRD
jgi:hypothetical protein